MPTPGGGSTARPQCDSVCRRCLGRAAWILIPLAAILAAAPPAVRAQELTLSVAVSMKEAAEEIGRRFVQRHIGVRLHYNFGGSGVLQKQIEAGAPVDVFISAADRQMDELQRKGVILAGSRRTFARNVLAVVVPAGTRLTIAGAADLARPQVGRIAIGNPKTVPAGQYAEESLRALGLWDSLRSKLVFGENVRQVLEYVARGEVEAGFVYATDLASRPGSVTEAFRPPQSSYPAVTYPAAVVAGSQHPKLGGAFVESLLGEDAQKTLGRLGFQPPQETR